MLYFRYPCRLLRVSYLHIRCSEQIIRIYSSQKPLPKQSLECSYVPVKSNELTNIQNPQFFTVNENIDSPKKSSGKNTINEVVKEKEDWKEVKLDISKLGKHCLKLSKFRLTSLVVITSAVGYAFPPTPFDPLSFLFCIFGTGLVSSAANSVNQFLEIPFDAQMSRTRNRVLVQGYMMPIHAVGFAAVAGTSGLIMLFYGTNALTAALGAINLLLYTAVYTPLKRISIVNTWVGSVVGAIPPLMGWAACQGSLDYRSLILGGILFAWQFPHFNALSWNLRPDYSRAGYRMMAVTDPDLCRKTALKYTIGIIALSSFAPVLDLTHWSFAFLSLPVNLYFSYLAFKFYKESDSKNSRKLFRFSLLHLPVLLSLMLILKKHWGFNVSIEGENMENFKKSNAEEKSGKKINFSQPSLSNSVEQAAIN